MHALRQPACFIVLFGALTLSPTTHAADPPAGPYQASWRSVTTHIRFTRKGNMLYAIALGWPEDGKLVIKTLGTGTRLADGPIRKVSLLGCRDEITWARTTNGLAITMPPKKPNEIAYAVRIEVDGKLDMTAE